MAKAEPDKCKELSSLHRKTTGRFGAYILSEGICADPASFTSVWIRCISFTCLYRSAFKCKKNVMWKRSVAGYMANVLQNSLRLHDELMSLSYRLSPYTIFWVHERKLRMIVATKMRDRVVQRSICKNYLYEAVTRHFIYDNAACQVGKGTDFVRSRLVHHLEAYYGRTGSNHGYVLMIDLHDYFGSTRHDMANAVIRKYIDDPFVYAYVCMVIDSFDVVNPGVGIGLGSELSQLIQLAILDAEDHFIKEFLHIKGYVRYMDDLVLIHEDREYLMYCRDLIEARINAKGLELNKKKTHIQPLCDYINFLGFRYKLMTNGRVDIKLIHTRISRERRRIKEHVRLVSEGRMTVKDARESLTCFKAHASKGNCEGLIRQMEEYFERTMKGAENVKNQDTRTADDQAGKRK